MTGNDDDDDDVSNLRSDDRVSCAPLYDRYFFSCYHCYDNDLELPIFAYCWYPDGCSPLLASQVEIVFVVTGKILFVVVALVDKQLLPSDYYDY